MRYLFVLVFLLFHGLVYSQSVIQQAADEVCTCVQKVNPAVFITAEDFGTEYGKCIDQVTKDYKPKFDKALPENRSEEDLEVIRTIIVLELGRTVVQSCSHYTQLASIIERAGTSENPIGATGYQLKTNPSVVQIARDFCSCHEIGGQESINDYAVLKCFYETKTESAILMNEMKEQHGEAVDAALHLILIEDCPSYKTYFLDQANQGSTAARTDILKSMGRDYNGEVVYDVDYVTSIATENSCDCISKIESDQQMIDKFYAVENCVKDVIQNDFTAAEMIAAQKQTVDGIFADPTFSDLLLIKLKNQCKEFNLLMEGR